MPISPGRSITVSEEHPANRGVLAHLRRSERVEARAMPPLSARPGDVSDPYMELGTHPDVVERVWDELGGVLHEDCRCVVHGTVALVEPHSGVVLAVGLGTSYALRITGDGDEARASGLETARTFRTTGDVLDLASWGDDWYFGSYARAEGEWLRRSLEHFAV